MTKAIVKEGGAFAFDGGLRVEKLKKDDVLEGADAAEAVKYGWAEEVDPEAVEAEDEDSDPDEAVKAEAAAKEAAEKAAAAEAAKAEAEKKEDTPARKRTK